MLTPEMVRTMLPPMDPVQWTEVGLALLKLSPGEAAKEIDRLPLGDRVALVLSQPPGRARLDLILRSANPAMLVEALPPEDLLVTVKTLGEADALPLLELSSDPQLGYLLDLETWVQEGVDVGRLEHWAGLLFECGLPRVLRWLRSTDFELLVLFFERVLFTVEREAVDDLPEALAGRVITPDGFHHLVVRLGADLDLHRKLIEAMYGHDREQFHALWGNLGTSPPTEVEELARRFRNGRLADRGWPDPEEAAAFYLPLRSEQRSGLAKLLRPLPNSPRYPLQRAAGPLLARALEHVRDEKARAVIATQLANLFNRVIVADSLPPGELDSLRVATERVGGRLEIGLSLLGAGDPMSALQLLSTVPLLDLCRIAQGAIHERTRRAYRLAHSPFAGWISFLGAPLPDRLRALLAGRALFLAEGQFLPREFASAADLAELDTTLDRIDTSLAFAEALGIQPSQLPVPFPPGCHPESREALSLETLLLTLFAREQVGLDRIPFPLPVGKLEQFLAALPEQEPALREEIQTWSRRVLAHEPPGQKALVGTLAAALLEEVLPLRGRPIDPRFFSGLWLQGS